MKFGSHLQKRNAKWFIPVTPNLHIQLIKKLLLSVTLLVHSTLESWGCIKFLHKFNHYLIRSNWQSNNPGCSDFLMAALLLYRRIRTRYSPPINLYIKFTAFGFSFGEKKIAHNQYIFRVIMISKFYMNFIFIGYKNISGSSNKETLHNCIRK